MTVPNDMRVVRSTATGSFVILPTVLVRERRLSSRARGVLAELLSRHPYQRLPSADEYASEYGEGRDVIRRAYRELKAVGYLRSKRQRGPRGRFIEVLRVFDQPTDDGIPVPGATSANTVNAQVTPATRKPTVGKHVVKYLEDEVQEKTKDEVLPVVAVGDKVRRAGVPDVGEPQESEVQVRTDDKAPAVPGQPVRFDAAPPSAPALDEQHRLPSGGCRHCFARSDWGEEHASWCRYRPEDNATVPEPKPNVPDNDDPGWLLGWHGLTAEEIKRLRAELPDDPADDPTWFAAKVAADFDNPFVLEVALAMDEIFDEATS